MLFFFPPGLSCLWWIVSVWQEVLQVLCFWQCRGQRSTMVNNGQHVVVCSRIHEIPLQATSGQSKSTPNLPNLEDLLRTTPGCRVRCSIPWTTERTWWLRVWPNTSRRGVVSEAEKSTVSYRSGKNDERCKFLVMIGYGYSLWLWLTVDWYCYQDDLWLLININ